MVCPLCQHHSTNVINSRNGKNTLSVWRRRQCPACTTTITTYEHIADKELPLVHSKNGVRRLSPHQLMISIYNELPSSDERADTAAAIAATVVNKLLKLALQRSIHTAELSNITYQTLCSYRPTAGLRYGITHGLVTA